MKKFLLIFFLFFASLSFAGNDEATVFFKKGKKTEKKSKQEAFEYYTKALDLSDPSWKNRKNCLLKRGILLYDSKKIMEALYDLSTALELDPTNFTLLKYTAKCLFHLGNYSQAIKTLDQIDKDKKDPEIHFLKARIYLMIYQSGSNTLSVNVLKSAVEEFSKAIDQNKKYYQAYFHRGRTFIILKALDEAAKDFENAIKYKKDYDYAWFELGKTLLLKQKHFESINAFEECIRINPKNYEALGIIISLTHDYSQKENTEKYLKIALQYYPKDIVFRKWNLLLKTVPENTLPVMEIESPIIQNPQIITPQEEIKPQKSMWLSLTDDEKITDKKDDKKDDNNLNIEFAPLKTENKQPPKKQPFIENQWY